MIYLPSSRTEREKFWDKHPLIKLSALLAKKYQASINTTKSIFAGGGGAQISFGFDLTITLTNNYFIKVKFRPEHSIYHYSFETIGSSYELSKESRRFRYKNPDLTTLYDAFDYLYKSIVREKEVLIREKATKEELQKKRLEEATEIAKAIHCNVDANVMYGTFTFNFTTMDGRDIKMKFRLDNDGEVDDFEIEGKIKKHHFYSLIDSLRKSVPDNTGITSFVKKRRIDLSSDTITRIAKNEKIKNLEFSKIRSWKRNFNLEEK